MMACRSRTRGRAVTPWDRVSSCRSKVWKSSGSATICQHAGELPRTDTIGAIHSSALTAVQLDVKVADKSPCWIFSIFVDIFLLSKHIRKLRRPMAARRPTKLIALLGRMHNTNVSAANAAVSTPSQYLHIYLPKRARRVLRAPMSSSMLQQPAESN